MSATNNSASTPSTNWREQIAGDEQTRFEGYAAFLAELQQKTKTADRTLRALHAKQVLGVRGEFTVLPDLPEHARTGLFATPKTHAAFVRFSNGANVPAHDGKSDIRGFAIKLLDVPGKKIIPGLESATTQDFLLIQSPVFIFKNSDEFIFFIRAAASPSTLLLKAFWRFGIRRALQIFGSFNKRIAPAVPTMAALQFYSAVAIKWGDYAVRLSVKPVAPAVPPTTIGDATQRDYLTGDLVARLKQGPLTYDFMIQYFVDEERTPIEDASVEWPESVSPFVTVARLVLPQQDLSAAEGASLREQIEKMSFDPWHAGEEFRPLGDVMRARSHAYRVSTQARNATSEMTVPPGS